MAVKQAGKSEIRVRDSGYPFWADVMIGGKLVGFAFSYEDLCDLAYVAESARRVMADKIEEDKRRTHGKG